MVEEEKKAILEYENRLAGGTPKNTVVLESAAKMPKDFTRFDPKYVSKWYLWCWWEVDILYLRWLFCNLLQRSIPPTSRVVSESHGWPQQKSWTGQNVFWLSSTWLLVANVERQGAYFSQKYPEKSARVNFFSGVTELWHILQGTAASLPWLLEITSSSKSMFEVLPVECVCEMLSNSLLKSSTTSERGEADFQKCRHLASRLSESVAAEGADINNILKTLNFFGSKLGAETAAEREIARTALEIMFDPTRIESAISSLWGMEKPEVKNRFSRFLYWLFCWIFCWRLCWLNTTTWILKNPFIVRSVPFSQYER